MIIQMSKKKSLEQILVYEKGKNQKFFNENLLFPLSGVKTFCVLSTKIISPQILGALLVVVQEMSLEIFLIFWPIG